LEPEARLEELGLTKEEPIVYRTGQCLRICEHGPIAVVPEGVWYTGDGRCRSALSGASHPEGRVAKNAFWPLDKPQMTLKKYQEEARHALGGPLILAQLAQVSSGRRRRYGGPLGAREAIAMEEICSGRFAWLGGGVDRGVAIRSTTLRRR
jgi:hypothetical protein